MKKCKTCHSDHDGSFGSGIYCSKSCAQSRGPRSKAVKEKIRQSNIIAAANRGDQWYESVSKANRSKRRIEKVRQTWINKRDYKTAHVSSVKKWILEETDKCEECGISEWNNNPITLEVHHIDGDNSNNSIENLQALCPNCHSMTPNWRGRKQI